MSEAIRCKRKRKRITDTFTHSTSPLSKRRKLNRNTNTNANDDTPKTNTNIDTLRHAIGFRNFEYAFDFDTNGFIHYLGTFNSENNNQNTRNNFKNPSEIGLVSVKSSRLKLNSAKCHYILNRTPQYIVTESVKNAYFVIDFSPSNCEILPSHYTLRHYTKHYNALRNWKFEGSNDGQMWYLLRAHTNDTTFDMKHKSFSWRILDTNTNKNVYYSMFRIMQIGENRSNNYELTLGGFEIYGNVRRKKEYLQTSNSNSVCLDDSDIEILPNIPKSESDSTIIVPNSIKASSMASDYSEAESQTPQQRLCEMGCDEYLVKESLKYVDKTDVNAMMDWVYTHKVTETETLNLKIDKICNIIDCDKYKALYALKQCNNDTGKALELLVKSGENKSFIVNPESTNQSNENNVFEKLTENERNSLREEIQMLAAMLMSLDLERVKEQKFTKMRPLISAELRSMCFLSIAIKRALEHSSVTDKKSAIQFILTHPLNEKQESNAKIQEIINSGYSKEEAQSALNQYCQNLNNAMSWLIQGKPAKIKHFLYHVSSKNVIQITADQNECEVTENIGLRNMNQHWSLYDDGKIKNFANNKILAIKCCVSENSYDLAMVLDSFDSENKESESEHKNESVFYKHWDIDLKEKTIKNRETDLYLVYRADMSKFYLEKTLHSGDMEQRWCFIDENELTKINPKELHKLLDSQEFECIICWENEPNLRLEPCGHSFCHTCIEELKPNECPICRTEIHSKQKFEE